MGTTTSLVGANVYLLSISLLFVLGFYNQSITSLPQDDSSSVINSKSIQSVNQTTYAARQENNLFTTAVPKSNPTFNSPQQELNPSVNLKFRLDKIQIGLIQSLFVKNNKFFLTGTYGLAILDLSKNETFIKRLRNTPIGVDNDSNIWYIIEKSNSIFRWDGANTSEFREENGWILPAKFFTPPLPTRHSFFLTEGKNIWLATSNDIRLFNGSRWRIFTANEIGIQLPWKAGIQSVFTISHDPSTGDIWVAACYWKGNQWIGGTSPFQFDGKSWHRTEFPVENICVTNLSIGNNGNILLTTPDSLWGYNGQEWTEISLPSTDAGSRNTTFRFDSMWTDKFENQWLLSSIIKPSGVVDQHILYQYKNQNLSRFASFKGLLPPRIFSKSFEYSIAFNEKQLYQVTPTGMELLSEHFFDLIAQDETGNIWLISDTKTRPVLWQLKQ